VLFSRAWWVMRNALPQVRHRPIAATPQSLPRKSTAQSAATVMTVSSPADPLQVVMGE
jgi:hypothetical protein